MIAGTNAPASPPLWTAQRIADYGGGHAWLVATDDGATAGYAYASARPLGRLIPVRAGRHLMWIPPLRAGDSAALYRALLPMLTGKGMHAAFAGIALPNAGSIGLHEATGFTPLGMYREVGWKLRAWRDLGWWQRLL